MCSSVCVLECVRVCAVFLPSCHVILTQPECVYDYNLGQNRTEAKMRETSLPGFFFCWRFQLDFKATTTVALKSKNCPKSANGHKPLAKW